MVAHYLVPGQVGQVGSAAGSVDRDPVRLKAIEARLRGVSTLNSSLSSVVHSIPSSRQ